MSMTETPAPKPAKKRPARAKPRPIAEAKPSIMDGITVTDCPMACTATKCAISGVGICSHPHKAGLQISVQNEDSLRRLNEARRILGQRKLDLQNQ